MEHENEKFKQVLDRHEGRILHQLNRMNIKDPDKEFYQTALIAMWNAYKTYDPQKGPMPTYFNFTIRNRLIDLIRKKASEQRTDEKFFHEEKCKIDNGNRDLKNGMPILEETGINVDHIDLWLKLKLLLTEKQWTWIHCFIILDKSIKEIARKNNVSEDVVKGWGREARKSLRTEKFKEIIDEFKER